MEADIFFNRPNLIFWTVLALVIWTETAIIAVGWPEPRRWWLGFATMFGGSLVMAWAGWDWRTIVYLAGLNAALRIARFDKWVFAVFGQPYNLWKYRESYRWTLNYFFGFAFGLFGVVWAGMDLLTWGLVLFSLGLCGAVKIGWAGVVEAKQSRELRKRNHHGL